MSDMSEILLRRNFSLLSELQEVAVREAYQDTSIVCRDGMMRCSRLVLSLVVADLYPCSLSGTEDCTLLLPDYSLREFSAAAALFFGGEAERNYPASSPRAADCSAAADNLADFPSDVDDDHDHGGTLDQQISQPLLCEEPEQETPGIPRKQENSIKEEECLPGACHEAFLGTHRSTKPRQQRGGQDQGAKLFCDQCNYQASDTSTLRSHVKSLHEGIRFKCNKCDFSARWERSVKRHRQTEHGGTRNSFLCHQCDYATSQHASLKRHIRVMHGEEREAATAGGQELAPGAACPPPFRCELCNFRARWRRSIRRHRLAVHESGGGRAHACSHCSYRATQAGTLRRHVRLVHSKEQQEAGTAHAASLLLPPPLARTESTVQDAVELAMAYSDIRL